MKVCDSMSFFSTRGHSCVTASQAILQGLSPDGGLYVPAMFPQLPLETLRQYVNEPYYKMVALILDSLVEDLSYESLLSASEAAYGKALYPVDIPLKAIDHSTYLFELFHGPTLSFKDIALSLFPHLLLLAKEKNHLTKNIMATIVTTGDTGAAALASFQKVNEAFCTVFFPKSNTSSVHLAQMSSYQNNTLKAIGVEENFAQLKSDMLNLLVNPAIHKAFEEKNLFLTSANSINFARLAPQISYYFAAYANLLSQGAIAQGDAVNFVIPTGNFGNVLAGFYARNMGLPISKLLIANNRNNALSDFFKTGTFSTHRLHFDTISPAITVQFPRNLERLLYDITDRDGHLVHQWMNLLSHSGSFSIGEQRMEWLSTIFASGHCDDIHTKKELKLLFDRFGLLLDPHSAVASNVLFKYREETGDNTPSIIMSTASPYKFPQEVLLAIDDTASPTLNPFEAMDALENISKVPIPPPLLKEHLSSPTLLNNFAPNLKQALLSVL